MNKQQTLDFITNAPGVIVGQHVGGGPGDWPSRYNQYMQGLYAATGKYPAVLSMDMAFCDWEHDPAWFNCTKDHHDHNGIVMTSWHVGNPVTGGRVDDLTPVDLTALITPGTSLNATWKAYCDVLVRRFLQLKSAGIPIIFRLFHEMNGAWHWYENQDRVKFVALWRYTKAYFDSRGCDNLIWCYGPSRQYSRIKSVLYYDPGTEYYDMVGVDHYGGDTSDLADSYTSLLTLGKPLVMAEYGPGSGAAPPANGTFDYSTLLPMLAKYPAFKMISSWYGGYSPLYQKNASMFYAGLITRDKIVPPVVPPVAPAPTAMITASVKKFWWWWKIALTWITANATSVNISGVGVVPQSGSKTLYVRGGNYTYALIATGAGGEARSSLSVSATYNTIRKV